ncbi:hypothetical protein L6164_011652 [Bauhinia variegata]|uniref:Uncharacterized protein n=1 Tax=Bauhinia variegata TaxID=167791 RepID=A0ACB9P6Y6_BAUVA|nr:hypothetical protein L6164_011652 [Bauhinia variegata]
MCHYGEQNDVEAGSSGSGVFDDSHSSDPFNITGTKKASLEHLKRWRQAALVLNASRRFRYTLDLKKEEDKRQTLRKNRAHAQLIRAAYLFKAAGAQINGIQKPLPTSTGEFAIGQEQLASISREHNITALQQYGGVKGLSDLLKTNLEKGVYGDDTDLVKRRNAFGSNTYPRKKGRSFLDLTFIILMVAAWPSLALGIKYEGIKEGWYDGGSIAFAVILVIVVTVAACLRRARKKSSPDTKSPAFAMDEFLNNMEREKPKRLTFQEIRLATNDFSHKLGSGGAVEIPKPSNPF